MIYFRRCLDKNNAHRRGEEAISSDWTTSKFVGGCYRAVPAGVPFSKMRGNCEGGLIASIHDADKANFVAQRRHILLITFFSLGFVVVCQI